MPIIPNDRPGIALTAVLDRASAQYGAEVKQLELAIEAARAKGLFQDFLSVKREEGSLLHVFIVPCKVAGDAVPGQDAAKALIQDLSSFTGTWKAPTAPVEGDMAAALKAAAAARKPKA